MSTLLFTILLAFIVVVIAIALLAIGWLLTGKNKIVPGACGRDPTKKRDKDCSEDNISCGLCKKNEDKNK